MTTTELTAAEFDELRSSLTTVRSAAAVMIVENARALHEMASLRQKEARRTQFVKALFLDEQHRTWRENKITPRFVGEGHSPTSAAESSSTPAVLLSR